MEKNNITSVLSYAVVTAMQGAAFGVGMLIGWNCIALLKKATQVSSKSSEEKPTSAD